ncbi:MAG: tRNA (adenosine(37)-N6)-threonylcarbamoyltransferase complex dimerization subunit type 1 TsaB [Candidatus Berkelbacteria bacterium]
MKLIIDTTDRNKLKIGLFVNNNLDFSEFETQDQSADILSKINQVIVKAKIESRDLIAILVCAGPGSYTGLRVAMAVANVMAWSLDIPVLAYNKDELEKVLSQNLDQKFSKIALPDYSN